MKDKNFYIAKLDFEIAISLDCKLEWCLGNNFLIVYNNSSLLFWLIQSLDLNNWVNFLDPQMYVFIFENRLKTYIISNSWNHILKYMPPLLRTPALPGTCTLHRITFITTDEGTYKPALYHSLKMKSSKSIISANIILWGRRWKQIPPAARPCVYNSKAELLKKWGFYSIWFLQENVDN